LKKLEQFKWFILGVLVAFILGSGIAFASTGTKAIDVVYNNIKLIIDGVEKKPSQEPFIYNGTTFVPLRFVSEALDKNVIWDGENKKIYIGDDVEIAKELKEIYMFDKALDNISPLVKSDQSIKGFVVGDLWGLKEKEGEKAYLTYNVNGLAKEMSFDMSMYALDGWIAKVKVLDEANTIMYESGSLMNNHSSKVTVPIENALKVTIQVETMQRGRGSMNTCAEISIANLKVLTTDY